MFYISSRYLTCLSSDWVLRDWIAIKVKPLVKYIYLYHLVVIARTFFCHVMTTGLLKSFLSCRDAQYNSDRLNRVYQRIAQTSLRTGLDHQNRTLEVLFFLCWLSFSHCINITVVVCPIDCITYNYLSFGGKTELNVSLNGLSLRD